MGPSGFTGFMVRDYYAYEPCAFQGYRGPRGFDVAQFQRWRLASLPSLPSKIQDGFESPGIGWQSRFDPAPIRSRHRLPSS